MPIDSVVIGPFKGGLNNISQAGEATDTEVVQLVNMNVTTDGALTSRLPMEVMPGITNAQESFDVLGIFRESPSMWYLVVQQRTTNGWEIKAFQRGNATLSTTIKATTLLANKVSAFVQVNDTGYFCAAPLTGSTMSGFKWKPGGNPGDISAMPKGNCMVSFKSRLWVTGTDIATTANKVWFSTIDSGGIKVETWNTGIDNFDVAPGEGGFNTAIIALNSALIILKNDGTWRFSYAATPAKGVVDKISGSIGAANKNVVVEFNNLVYTYDQGKLYELVNSNFSAINRSIEFREDSEAVHIASGTDLSVVGTNIVLRYFNALYVYSGETGTWSQWRSTLGIPGKFIELVADSNSSKPSVYIAPSKGSVDKSNKAVPYNIIQLNGDYSSILPVENIECVMRTKSYDYKAPSVYKRLFWWGIDHKSFTTFKATVIPIVRRRRTTWGQLRKYTWGDMRKGIWGNPLRWVTVNTSVSDDFNVSNEQTDNGRIFSKIRAALMFRQVAFEIRMNTKGNATTGPVKIFSLVSYVSAKHNVVDKNN